MRAARLSNLLLLAAMACAGAEDPEEILRQVKKNVSEQIAESANYACTETLIRSYFRPITALSAACGPASPPPQRKQFARDQLRLDVAVSKDAELYSWHGENQFSSNRISDIVETGPISSGGFVGYLQNIFLGKGIEFTYTGTSSLNGKQLFNFDFVVSKEASAYTILVGTEYQVVPFHGSFGASGGNFELVTLKVVPDEIPFGSNMCSAQTEIHYQLAPISGRDALIPESFQFTVDDDQHVYIVSRGQYQQCHEFRSESTLRFDYSDAESHSGVLPAGITERVPAGVTLHLALTTPVNNDNSYAGDPVDAVLLAPVKLPGASGEIPRGARVHGVITQFDSRLEPSEHFFLKIVFERITAANKSYTLLAVHKPSGKELDKITPLFGGIVPKPVMIKLNEGMMIIPGKRLDLDQRFKGEWRTVALASAGQVDTEPRKNN